MTTKSEEISQAYSTRVKTPGKYVLTRNFILRMTGFPIEMIESLASVHLADATDALLRTRQQLLSESQAHGTGRQRNSPLDGTVGHEIGDDALRLSQLLEREGDLLSQAADLYQQELYRARTFLYEFVLSEPFQQVLLLSSPELGRVNPKGLLPPEIRNSQVRKREFSWTSYLQRLTTKNETISFFGPCAWGEFDAKEASPAQVDLAEQRISKRVVYVERWLCEALARLMSADPEVRPLLPLRLTDDAIIRRGEATLAAGGKTFPLQAEEEEFLRSCAVMVRYVSDTPFANNLLEKKLVTCDLQLSPEALPFAVLEKEVSSWPDLPVKARWQEILAEIERGRAGVERATEFEARRAAINTIMATVAKLGLAGQRDAQTLYTSRLPINEDCQVGTRSLTLGSPVIEQLVEDGAPWYDLWRDVAGLYATRFHESMRESWHAMGGKPLPLPAFWPALTKAFGRLPEIEREIQQAWHAQLGDRWQQSVVSLTKEDTNFLQYNFRFRRMKAFDNLAPDFQIVARDREALEEGRWSLLLAEIHPDFTPWQHGHFVWCPGVESYSRDYAHQGGQGAAAVLGRFPPYFASAHTSLWVYPFTHEWGFVGAPGIRGVPGVRSADTMVLVTEDDVLLMHSNGRTLGSLVHTWQTALNTHRLELHGNNDHSPRLKVGRLTVQRESWRPAVEPALAVAAKAGGYAAFTAFREFRKRHGLPERVFVRGLIPARLTLDKDIKPVFIDFRNPLLVELLNKLVMRFPRLLITEMFPNLEDCWLEGARSHYTSEFRTVILASRETRAEEAGRWSSG